MKRTVHFVLAAAGFAVGGLAFAGQAFADDMCLTPRQVQGWNNLDDHAITVRVTGGQRYRVDLGGTCIGLKNAVSLKLSSRGTGLCVAAGDYISYRYHGFGEQRCLISAVRPYTPESERSAPPQAEQPSGD